MIQLISLRIPQNEAKPFKLKTTEQWIVAFDYSNYTIFNFRERLILENS